MYAQNNLSIEYRSCARRTPCLNGNGTDYDGTVMMTETGKFCEKWSILPTGKIRKWDGHFFSNLSSEKL